MDAETKQGQKAPLARPSTISKHTPGPWRYIRRERRGDQSAWPIIIVSDEDGVSITSEAVGAATANAKLLAAAPALADALARLLEEVKRPTDASIAAYAALRAAGRLADGPGTARGARPRQPTPSPKASP